MQLFSGVAELPEHFGPSVLTLGNFDGVHRGHQEVLAAVLGEAKERHASAVAITFDPHPTQVHRPGSEPEAIMGLQDRLDTLAELGIDATLLIHYTLDFAAQSPEEFVQKVFVDALGACAVVIGHDVRFGKDNAGDLQVMIQLGRKYGFDVIAIDDFGGERRSSSTWVREALRAGDVSTAATILGRPHRISATVVHGAKRGRDLGFPTANLAPESQGYIPADGVYAGSLVDEHAARWPAAISVGSNPTFDGVSRQVEAHVIDRPEEAVEDFDLYGQWVSVEFVSRLRPMLAYTGAEDLVCQMRKDVDDTRDILAHSRA